MLVAAVVVDVLLFDGCVSSEGVADCVWEGCGSGCGVFIGCCDDGDDWEVGVVGVVCVDVDDDKEVIFS